jgi:hypothetical protein
MLWEATNFVELPRCDPEDQKDIGDATINQGDLYEIHLVGYLDEGWSDWLDGMKISNIRKGETVLSGKVPDQPALYGLLLKIRDLNMKLILVKNLSA